jgi:hypothetical protein
MTDVMEAPTIDFALRARQYRTLKAKIEDIKDRHKAELAPLNEVMEELKNHLLDCLNRVNSENIQTEDGTIHKTSRKTASVSDQSEFLAFVIENRAWEMLDLKCNATAADDYISEHGEPPPGVNFNVHITASVLAPRKKG